MDRIERINAVVSGADVPFGGLDDDQLFLGVQTPKNENLGAWIGISSHFCKRIQIPISSKLCIGLAQNLTGWCSPTKRLRGCPTWWYKYSKMADGRHLEFRFLTVISASINIFAPNLVPRWKTNCLKKPICHKSNCRKSIIWAMIWASIKFLHHRPLVWKISTKKSDTYFNN